MKIRERLIHEYIDKVIMVSMDWNNDNRCPDLVFNEPCDTLQYTFLTALDNIKELYYKNEDNIKSLITKHPLVDEDFFSIKLQDLLKKFISCIVYNHNSNYDTDGDHTLINATAKFLWNMQIEDMGDSTFKPYFKTGKKKKLKRMLFYEFYREYLPKPILEEIYKYMGSIKM